MTAVLGQPSELKASTGTTCVEPVGKLARLSRAVEDCDTVTSDGALMDTSDAKAASIVTPAAELALVTLTLYMSKTGTIMVPVSHATPTFSEC